MANVLVEESYLQGIANAIRSKNGTQSRYTPQQMSQAIINLSGGQYDEIILSNGVLSFPNGHCLCLTERIRLIIHNQPLVIS